MKEKRKLRGGETLERFLWQMTRSKRKREGMKEGGEMREEEKK
jgi:hypothetical protein